MEKRILGLDPGLAILGFGLISCPCSGGRNTQCISTIDFGVIQTSAKQEIGQRLHTIYHDLHAVINQLQPHLVAIEKLFYYRMGNTIEIAQARGVMMLVLAQHQLPFVEYTPAQIKLALTGYGNADKLEVQQAIARELHFTEYPKPDDAADALAVALTAWFHQDIS